MPNMPKYNHKFSLLTYLFFGLWLGFFLLFWAKAIYYDEFGNLVAGHVNIWGDWATHFTMANAMATRGLLLQTSPFLLGAKFSYPFAADLISAILIRLTGNLVYSFLVPSLIGSLFFVWAIYYFFKTLWGSEKKAILSSVVFLLNGGLGFYYYFRDNLPHRSFLSLVVNPLHEMTRYDLYQIKWISVIDSMIIPQRAFLLGFPLTLVALTFIYQYFFQHQLRGRWKLGVASLTLGLMPLIHTHSFLAAFIILAFWSAKDLLNQKTGRWWEWRHWPSKRLKSWALLAAATALISLPLMIKYFFGQIDHGFAKFFPGWLANSYQMNWLVFWWRNWFLTPWLAGAGFWLIIKHHPKQLLTFAPFIVIFALANLFLFQPFAWDNTKLIIWASLGFSYLVVLTFAYAYKNQGLLRSWPWLKTGILSLIFSSIILSGAIDVYYISRHDLHTYVMYTQEELELVEWVKNNTPRDAIWLTGDRHNHPIFNLTGRQTVITYEGVMWTHGYDYLAQFSAVKAFYQDPSRHLDVLKKYQVRYIIIGGDERAKLRARDEDFLPLFPLVKETSSYKIFENKYN